MLKWTAKEPCWCCTDPNPKRVYSWMNNWHCLTCLHSIGRNAAGNHCTQKQYDAAWKELSR
jgi:hypothetical protein